MTTSLAAVPYAVDVRVARKMLGLSECSSCSGLGEAPPLGEVCFPVLGVVSMISAAACGYHGYKRNDSVGWAVAWFMLGGLMPVLVPVVAVAQGFGEPAGR